MCRVYVLCTFLCFASLPARSNDDAALLQKLIDATNANTAQLTAINQKLDVIAKQSLRVPFTAPVPDNTNPQGFCRSLGYQNFGIARTGSPPVSHVVCWP
jgi:hypothetical protein